MEKTTIEVPSFIANLPFLKDGKGSLSGYRTYITAALGIVTAVLTFLTGGIEFGEALAAIWAAIMAIFVRSGVDKASDDAAEKTIKKLEEKASPSAQANPPVAPPAPVKSPAGTLSSEPLPTPAADSLATGNG